MSVETRDRLAKLVAVKDRLLSQPLPFVHSLRASRMSDIYSASVMYAMDINNGGNGHIANIPAVRPLLVLP